LTGLLLRGSSHLDDFLFQKLFSQLVGLLLWGLGLLGLTELKVSLITKPDVKDPIKKNEPPRFGMLPSRVLRVDLLCLQNPKYQLICYVAEGSLNVVFAEKRVHLRFCFDFGLPIVLNDHSDLWRDCD
jgi:hypothetical protein